MVEPNWIGLLPEGRTISECTEAIETLKDLLSHYRRRREAMARSVRMQAIMADPVKRAEYRAKVIAGVHASHRKLPSMTAEQKRNYERLTYGGGMKRELALAEVFSPAGATQAGYPPAPVGDGGFPPVVARPAHTPDFPGGARTLSGRRNGELAK